MRSSKAEAVYKSPTFAERGRSATQQESGVLRQSKRTTSGGCLDDVTPIETTTSNNTRRTRRSTEAAAAPSLLNEEEADKPADHDSASLVMALEEEISSVVFHNDQLFTLPKGSSGDADAKNSQPVTCTTAGLIMDAVAVAEEEKIDTPNTHMEDAGSTEGEDEEAAEEVVCSGPQDEESATCNLEIVVPSTSETITKPASTVSAKATLFRRKTTPVLGKKRFKKHPSCCSDTEDSSSSSFDYGNVTLMRQSSDGGSNQSILHSLQQTGCCTAGSNKRVYPLRSRLKKDALLKEYRAKQVSPKSFIELPTEVLLRIMHYLNIQDLFRVQLVCKRLHTVVDRYLYLVKRINFSSGLPFAYLPGGLGDQALKRILARTPEVTHILGFYPKLIHGTIGNTPVMIATEPSQDQLSQQQQQPLTEDQLSYSGIIDSFSKCQKLRSVELMDVQLMSQLVACLPRVKFHGMFRNRPDSWDSEYAVPMPVEPQPTAAAQQQQTGAGLSTPYTSFFSWWLSTLYGMLRTVSHLGDLLQQSAEEWKSIPQYLDATSMAGAQMALLLSHRASMRSNRLAARFEPQLEAPIGYGSPFASLVSIPGTAGVAVAPNQGAAVANNQQQQQQQQALLNNAHAHLMQVVAGGGGLPDNLQLDFLPELLLRVHQNHRANHTQGGGLAALAGNNNLNPLNNANNQATTAVIPQAQRQAMFVFAIAAALNWVLPDDAGGLLSPQPQLQQLFAAAGDAHIPPALRRLMLFLIQPQQSVTDEVSAQQQQQQQQQQPLVTPIPSARDRWVNLPPSIANLTKLDLVSVVINILPRLDNIKYLHLKWVHFTSFDPFNIFAAPKLQSFVMNNCVGPTRGIRYIRIFAALSRAIQLSRLELVGCRFFDGLIENLTDNNYNTSRCFRNLQRLVLAGNRDVREIDLGILLIASQQSLSHFALQTYHTKNSLFEALLCARVSLNKLESLVLGYQDPYQTRLTVNELHSAELVDSADNIMPLCSITDRGIEHCLKLCPRLGCLTIRHAPFLHNMRDWRSSTAEFPGTGPTSNLNSQPAAHPIDEDDEDETVPTTEDEYDVPRRSSRINAAATASSAAAAAANGHHHNHHHGHHHNHHHDSHHMQQHGTSSTPGSSVRSLTLENCPGLGTETLEDAIYFGDPFPCLETLVLRNMFLARPGPRNNLEWTEAWLDRWQSRLDLASPAVLRQQHREHRDQQEQGVHSAVEMAGMPDDYRTVSLLLSLADSLSVNGLGQAPLSKTGVGLGTSCRDVSMQSALMVQLRPMDRIVNMWNIFLSLRVHTYLNTIMQLDGSCGRGLLTDDARGMPLLQAIVFGREPLFYPVSVAATGSVGNKSKKRKSDFQQQQLSTEWINSQVPVCPLDEDQKPAQFVSQATQTCICGLLEVDSLVKLTHPSLVSQLPKRCKPELSSQDDTCCSDSTTDSVLAQASNKRKRTRQSLLLENATKINFIIRDGDSESSSTNSIDRPRRVSLARRRESLRPRAVATATGSSSSRGVSTGQSPSSRVYEVAHGPDGVHPPPLPYMQQQDGAIPDLQPQPPSYLQQLEGPLAFHPYPVSSQHSRLYDLHVATNTPWTSQVTPKLTGALYPFRMEKQADGSYARRYDEVPLITQCLRCSLCCQAKASISDLTSEWGRKHEPRVWLARDVCLDTSELRCANGSALPNVLTLTQPMRVNFCCLLTTLHFEKVGITHLVLTGLPRLKNISLENCPELRGILLHQPAREGENEDQQSATMQAPSLRRVRIIRCPRFAIYNWLYQCARLYPRHEENLFITYRPFGQYNPAVERALWENCAGAHVMVSADYKRHESERRMEEFHSSFDQLLREVMSFSDMLIRRELVQPTEVLPGAANYFTRSEHGNAWDLVTDIPWVHEVCCSMLPNSNNLKRCTNMVVEQRGSNANSNGTSSGDQVDQLYELLSEVQTVNQQFAATGSGTASSIPCGLEVHKTWKVARRGVHLHVQYRDTHAEQDEDENMGQDSLPGGMKQTGGAEDEDPLSNWFHTTSWYTKYAYSERYLSAVKPQDDWNVWDDGLDWETSRALPPKATSRKDQMPGPEKMESWQRVLLSQERPEEALLPDEKQMLLMGQSTPSSRAAKRNVLSHPPYSQLQCKRRRTMPVGQQHSSGSGKE